VCVVVAVVSFLKIRSILYTVHCTVHCIVGEGGSTMTRSLDTEGFYVHRHSIEGRGGPEEA
jgi:hypothetical protein